MFNSVKSLCNYCKCVMIIQAHALVSIGMKINDHVLRRKHPKPNLKAAMPPRLDQFVFEFAGKKPDKARDTQLAKR